MGLARESVGSPVTISGIVDATNRPSANELVVLINTTGTTYEVRRYTTASGHAQNGSDVTLTNTATNTPRAITMLTADIALIVGTTSVSWHVDLTTDTVTELTSEAPRNNNPNQTQVIIGNRNGKAYAISNTSGNIIKYDSTGPAATASAFPIPLQTSESLTCVCNNTSNNNFIFGHTTGKITEIDSSGAVVKQLTLPEAKGPLVNSLATSGLPTNRITGMAYTYGFLLVTTAYGRLYVIDYATGVPVFEMETSDTAYANTSTMTAWACAEPDDPYVLLFMPTGPGLGPGLMMLDPCKAGCPELGNYYSVTTGQFFNAGSQGTVAWAIQSNALHWITVSSRRSVTTTNVTISDGGPVAGNCYIIDDSTIDVIVWSPVGTSGRDLPVTTGKNPLVVVTSGIGVNTKSAVNRITT